jgi:hypothetical protein
MPGEWEELCRPLPSEAAGYAETDPVNGDLYETDAVGFGRLPAPAAPDAWRERRERADELRRLWRHRSDRTRKP